MSTNAPPLPQRDGVGASCISLPAGPWATMAEFLQQRFAAIAPQEWLRRLADGEVVNEQGRPVRADAPYRPHQKLYYYRTLPPEQSVPFQAEVLYRDEVLLVVDKPHFLPVTPAGRFLQETLLVRLKRELGLEQLAPVHRIDRETAGLVLFTLQPQHRETYHALFREHRVEKQYEAIARWRPELALPLTRRSRLVEGAHFMCMAEADGEPNAETRIALSEVRGTLARYALSPLTGQRHQLRVHMQALGLPILNDRIYPVLQPPPASGQEDYTHPLQLVSRSLAFTDPLSGRPMRFESRRSLTW